MYEREACTFDFKRWILSGGMFSWVNCGDKKKYASNLFNLVKNKSIYNFNKNELFAIEVNIVSN